MEALGRGFKSHSPGSGDSSVGRVKALVTYKTYSLSVLILNY